MAIQRITSGILEDDITITGTLTGNVTGNLTGDVTGNLTGDSFGNHTGAVTGDVTGNVTGTAATITTTLDIAYGGTGATSSTSALDNLLPGGEASGYVLKTGGAGSYYWGSANVTSSNTSVGSIVNSTRIITTATASQTVFTTPTYTQGANQLRVYINGVRQFPSAYTETSNTSFTLSTGVASGSVVLAEVDGYIDYTVNATDVIFSPTSDVTANNVQDAIAEVGSDLTNLVVQTSGIADANVTTAKLADSAVTTAKIGDGEVTVAKISATGTASSGTFLRGDGAWQAAGGFSNMEVFTSPGTWTNPGQVTKVKVTVVGGGSGYFVQPGSWPVGTQTTTPGGTSSFGSYCSATGGTGWSTTTPATAVISIAPGGGLGGAGTGGDLNIPGTQWFDSSGSLSNVPRGAPQPSGPQDFSRGGDTYIGRGASSTSNAVYGGGGWTDASVSNTGGGFGGAGGGTAIEVMAIPTSPVPITVGSAGPNLTSPNASGRGGAAGVVIVEY